MKYDIHTFFINLRYSLPSVLWRCWLGSRKGIQPVKNSGGVLAWLSEWSAHFHMAKLMPLPLTVACFSKIQIGFAFLVPANLGSPGQRAVWEDPGLNLTVDGCVYLNGHCDMLPWARAVCTFIAMPGSTQPCIPLGSLNRVPASAGVRAGMSPLSGGR